MTGRMRRVDKAVRQVVSDVIASELKDPRVGFVTVTGVECARDLRRGTVHVSVLGSEPEREATLAALQAAHGYVQRRVAGELGLKRTPQLTFAHDDSVRRGMRISQLLDAEARR
jgi:ribosome-binding factor A